ncbi:MAG: hypothetical protein WBD99_00995 [Thermodesulfobacteriota bacterium]
MRIWMLILGIALVSVFSDQGSALSRYESTIATAQETEPAPTPTPSPEMESNLR